MVSSQQNVESVNDEIIRQANAQTTKASFTCIRGTDGIIKSCVLGETPEALTARLTNESAQTENAILSEVKKNEILKEVVQSEVGATRLKTACLNGDCSKQ